MLAETPSYDSLILQGRQALHAGNTSLAYWAATQAISLDSSRWEGYLIAGATRIQERDCDGAKRILSKAEEVAPEDKRVDIGKMKSGCIDGSSKVKFPTVDSANFSAASPTPETVEAFLQESWGYDSNREWELYSIEGTSAPEVSKVRVLMAENPAGEITAFEFLVLPDGKHLVTGGSVISFGARPFDDAYRMLRERVSGPSLGTSSMQYLLVEFGELGCVRCKEEMSVEKKLLADFPQAHYVFENVPASAADGSDIITATYGACVHSQGGSSAFFTFAQAIDEVQHGLSSPVDGQELRKAAVAAGVDPQSAARCADSSTAQGTVNSAARLARDLDVETTPFLFIDGRGVPLLAVPYATLKEIVAWQFEIDKLEFQAGP